MSEVSSTPVAHVLSYTTPADDSAVSETLQDLKTALASHGIESGMQGRIVSCLAEILNNIAEHGFPKSGATDIKLTLNILADAIQVSVRDTGRSVPDEVFFAPELPDMSGSLDSLPEGGFGWYLIHKLTDELSYHRDGVENQVVLAFY